MKLEGQVKQLTELMADLIPAVDRLTQNQKENTDAINQVVDIVAKTNLGMPEMRVSNMRLAEVIEKLVVKIDRVDQFKDRLVRLEKSVFK
ncbi:MAG: hypothetical protein ACKVOQ_10170 [Cyclobacteriaceae bacterium]